MGFGKLGRHDIGDFVDIIKYDISFLNCFLSDDWSKFDSGRLC